jgi:hypothetical protein
VRRSFQTVSGAGLWPFVSERGRVRSSPQSAERGDRDAHPTNPDDTGSGSLRLRNATPFEVVLVAGPNLPSCCEPNTGVARKATNLGGSVRSSENGETGSSTSQTSVKRKFAEHA